MRLKSIAAALAFAGALGLLAAPADAAPKKRVVVSANRGNTVYTSRDEDGRTRTRIIIQKRSFLDPGTETFAGERSDHEYAMLPGQHATSDPRQHHLRDQYEPAAGPVHAAGTE